MCVATFCCVCCWVQVAPGMLITFLQKGLAYVGIEEHLNEVRKISYIMLYYPMLYYPMLCYPMLFTYVLLCVYNTILISYLHMLLFVAVNLRTAIDAAVRAALLAERLYVCEEVQPIVFRL